MGALVYEFWADGTVHKSMKTASAPFPLFASGKYTFFADDIIQIQFDPPPPLTGEKLPQPPPQKAKVAVAKDELTLTPEGEKQGVLKLKKKT
jgi:hypothetical protein